MRIRERFETWLRQAPFLALRDVVEKQPSEGRNLAALDGIRGMAVMIVVASHTQALNLHAHGGVGVWLFFSLSAFLLTMPFAARPQRARQLADLGRYYRRRIGRIVPMYYLVLVASFLCQDTWTSDELVRHLLFLRGDGVYWSIPQEMLFYLLLPVLVALLTPLLRQSDPAMALVLGAMALAANLWLDESILRLHGNRKWLPFYFGIFATGMAFSHLYRWEALSRVAGRPGVNRILHGIGIAILLALVLTAPHYHRLAADAIPALQRVEGPLGWTHPGVFGLLCSALIWITLLCEGRFLHRLMSSLVLRAIGLVSFSIYLLHIPVRNQLLRLGVQSGMELFVCTTAATYVLAAVTYALVERRFARAGLQVRSDRSLGGTRV